MKSIFNLVPAALILFAINAQAETGCEYFELDTETQNYVSEGVLAAKDGTKPGVLEATLGNRVLKAYILPDGKTFSISILENQKTVAEAVGSQLVIPTSEKSKLTVTCGN
jgi:hypothetical protein